MPQASDLYRIKNGFSTAQSILARYICLLLFIGAFAVFGKISLDNKATTDALMLEQAKMKEVLSTKFPLEFSNN